MPGHCHSNLDPDLVDQVNPGKDGLIGPLGHDVLLNPDLLRIKVKGFQQILLFEDLLKIRIKGLIYLNVFSIENPTLYNTVGIWLSIVTQN